MVYKHFLFALLGNLLNMRNISCPNMVDTVLDNNIPIFVANETNIINLSNEPLGVPDNCTIAGINPVCLPFKTQRESCAIFFQLSFVFQ